MTDEHWFRYSRDASPQLARVHRAITETLEERTGRVPNRMQNVAVSSALLEGYLTLSGAFAIGVLSPQTV